MLYTLLVCREEGTTSETDQNEVLAAFTAFQDQMVARGVMISSHRLKSVETATSVRIRNGDLVIADGPFAETKEQIAGFYIVDCADLDEAIEVASGIPAAHVGTIEVRPIWDLGDA